MSLVNKTVKKNKSSVDVGSLSQSYYDGLIKETSNTSVDLDGLIGAPFRWNELADPRISNNNENGKEWTDLYVKYGNFLAMTFGIAKSNLLDSRQEKKVMKNLASGDAMSMDETQEIFEKIGDGQLFEFTNAMSTYWNYVNVLVKMCASLLDIDDAGTYLTKQKMPFSMIHWGSYTSRFLNDTMSGTIGNNAGIVGHDKERIKSWGFVPFYTDGIIGSGESVSSSVGKSSVESMWNNNPLNNIAKEMSVITGAEISENINKTAANEEVVGGGAMSKLFGLGTNTFNVNIKAPEIWKDSSYDKQYQIPIRLSTPYGNPVSSFKNIIIPICHILPFALPRQKGASNLYTSPYILRAFSRGNVNCMMGMVTNINIQRNNETISVDGLPTDVLVTLTVKDLMPTFSLPEKLSGIFKTDMGQALAAAGLFNYVGTLCGFNLNNPDVSKLVAMHTIGKMKTFGQISKSVKWKVTDASNNISLKFLEPFIKL